MELLAMLYKMISAPNRGAVTAQKFTGGTEIVRKLCEVFNGENGETTGTFDRLTGIETSRVYTGESEVKFATNKYVDALRELRRKIEADAVGDMDSRLKDVLTEFGELTDNDLSTMKESVGLPSLEGKKSKQVKLEKFLRRHWDKGFHAHTVQVFSSSRTDTVELVPGVYVKFSPKEHGRPASVVLRPDHSVVTFAAAEPEKVLTRLSGVTPGMFWKPFHSGNITSEATPFNTYVGEGGEGDCKWLAPQIHLNPNLNGPLVGFMQGNSISDPDMAETLNRHQISKGIMDSNPRNSEQDTWGQWQHFAIESRGPLEVLIDKFKAVGINMLPAPEEPDTYYNKVRQSSFQLIIAQVLELYSASDLSDGVQQGLKIMSEYSFKLPETLWEEIKADLLSAHGLDEAGIAHLDQIRQILGSLKGVFDDHEYSAGGTNLDALILKTSEMLSFQFKLDVTADAKAIFKHNLTIAFRQIQAAQESGYFIENVVRWDPEGKKMTGGTLNQTFTEPIEGYKFFFEPVERTCYVDGPKLVDIKGQSKVGCSLFGGGDKEPDPHGFNNFRQLISGQSKVFDNPDRKRYQRPDKPPIEWLDDLELLCISSLATSADSSHSEVLNGAKKMISHLQTVLRK